MNMNILGPDAIEWLGVHYRTILKTGDSGGAISVVDSVSPPKSGPPRHIHHEADETFVVLTGDILFWLEGEEHTFQVISDTPSRHLVILTPGGFEGFFAEMAAGQFRIPQDMPAVAEAAARYRMDFTGPPL